MNELVRMDNNYHRVHYYVSGQPQRQQLSSNNAGYRPAHMPPYPRYPATPNMPGPFQHAMGVHPPYYCYQQPRRFPPHPPNNEFVTVGGVRYSNPYNCFPCPRAVRLECRGDPRRSASAFSYAPPPYFTRPETLQYYMAMDEISTNLDLVLLSVESRSTFMDRITLACEEMVGEVMKPEVPSSFYQTMYQNDLNLARIKESESYREMMKPVVEEEQRQTELSSPCLEEDPNPAHGRGTALGETPHRPQPQMGLQFRECVQNRNGRTRSKYSCLSRSDCD